MATTDPTTPQASAARTPLILIAVIATIFILEWAQAVFIPLVLALVISYALSPVVDRLARFAIPRALSAAVLLLAIVIGAGAATWSLRDEAVSLIDTLPEAVQKFQEAARKEFEGPGRAIERMQAAAEELERATVEGAETKPPPGVTRVQIERPKLNIREYLVTSLAGGVAMIGAGMIVLFLAYLPARLRRRVPAQVGHALGADARQAASDRSRSWTRSARRSSATWACRS